MTEHHGENAHGGPKLYWIFAVILCVITFFEWLLFKYRVPWSIGNNILVPALLSMSAVKFVMVVGWYMHLRYDPSWLNKVFITSLAMGGGTAIVLFLLMN